MTTYPARATFARDRTTWLAYSMLALMSYVPGTLGPSIPFLRAELHLSYTQAGLLPSAIAVGMVCSGMTADRLAGRLGRRFVLWAGGSGLAAGGVCLALVHQVGPAILSAFLMGFFGSLALVMVQAILSDRHGERRAIALTEANIAASLSTCLAPLLVGGFQLVGLGWRGALFLGALLLALIAARFRRTPVPNPPPDSGQRGSSSGHTLPPAFWAYWWVIFLVVSIEWCFLVWGAEYLEKVIGLSKINASTTMSLFLLAMVMGRVAGSRLTRVMPVRVILLLALGVTMLGFPVFWLARPAWLNLVGLFIAGLGVANLFPLSMSAAVSVDPGQANLASARVSLGSGSAILLIPLLLGWTADRVSLQNAYGIVAILLVVAAAVTYFNGRVIRERGAGAWRPAAKE